MRLLAAKICSIERLPNNVAGWRDQNEEAEGPCQNPLILAEIFTKPFLFLSELGYSAESAFAARQILAKYIFSPVRVRVKSILPHYFSLPT
jgi:hypothetical protein